MGRCPPARASPASMPMRARGSTTTVRAITIRHSGQFTSADTAMDGLNRYGYVGGNPITWRDPSGHMADERGAGEGGAGSVGEGESNENLAEPTASGEGVAGGGDGVATGPASDVSSDMTVAENPDGSYTYSVPDVTQADLEAETRDIEQSKQQFHNDERPQESQNPQQPSNPTNTPNNQGNPEIPNTPQTPSQPGNSNTTPTVDPQAALDDLAQQRVDQGVATAGSEADVSTFARLDVNGESYYGQNGQSQPITLKVNAISKFHAETNAFQRAYNDGVQGGDGILYVDRPMCLACGQNGAVRSLGMQLGLTSLIVFDPFGAFLLI